MAKDKSLVIKSGNGTLVTDVQELRRPARAHIERGAVTESYRGDVETELRMLPNAEQRHLDQIAERITQVGGEPDLKDER